MIADLPNMRLGPGIFGAAFAVATLVWGIRRSMRQRTSASAAAQSVNSSRNMNEDVFLSKLSDAVLIVGRDGLIASASRGAARVLGFTPDALRNRRLSSLVHEDYIAEASQAIARVADGAELHLPQRWRVRGADGSWIDAECTATRLADAPVERCVVIALRETPARDAASQGGEGLRDPLTGLASRALFRDRAEHALARAHRLQLHWQCSFWSLKIFDRVASAARTMSWSDSLSWRPPVCPPACARRTAPGEWKGRASPFCSKT